MQLGDAFSVDGVLSAAGVSSIVQTRLRSKTMDEEPSSLIMISAKGVVYACMNVPAGLSILSKRRQDGTERSDADDGRK